MTTPAKPDAILDCQGLSCPLPVIKTKKTIDGMLAGQVLQMIATDRGSVNDMNAWSRRTGHSILSTEQENEVFTFYIRKA